MVDLENLKVCFVAGTLGRGGAERQLIYMLKALHNAGVATRVLCLTKGEPLEEEIKAMGIKVTWVGRSRWRPVRLCRIIRELRRERAHILQSAHFYTNLYVAVASRALKIKGIGAIRSDLSSELKINGLMGWWHLHLPQHLIANSEVARRNAIVKGRAGEDVNFVPNAVEVRPRTQARNGNGNAIQVLFAGGLCEPKRADRFLRVMSKLVKSRPDLKVKSAIAGDGPLRSSLEQLAARLGLDSEHVEFLGNLHDVGPFYYKSDLLMLTSDWEGTPNVLLEAMACGLPVVATGVGGIPELIGTDRGLIVEPDDEDGLTAATIRMIDDRNLRSEMSRHGREYVARFHSLGTVQNQLLPIYEKVLSR
jgi:glycosyltransferase involved in cell wall biosynthesis